MKPVLAIALLAFLAPAATLAHTPQQALKGKLKPGLYAYKMEMDMGQLPPGMPKGAMAPRTFQQCVTPQDIERGEMGKGPEGAAKSNCEMQDFRMSGNTATYKMVCKGESGMTADNAITFLPDGFNMNMKMSMVRGGQTMNMAQKMEGRYLGPCPAPK